MKTFGYKELNYFNLKEGFPIRRQEFHLSTQSGWASKMDRNHNWTWGDSGSPLCPPPISTSPGTPTSSFLSVDMSVLYCLGLSYCKLRPRGRWE
jgi:hypothetical protein